MGVSFTCLPRHDRRLVPSEEREAIGWGSEEVRLLGGRTRLYGISPFGEMSGVYRVHREASRVLSVFPLHDFNVLFHPSSSVSSYARAGVWTVVECTMSIRIKCMITARSFRTSRAVCSPKANSSRRYSHNGIPEPFKFTVSPPVVLSVAIAASPPGDNCWVACWRKVAVPPKPGVLERSSLGPFGSTDLEVEMGG